MEEKQVSYTKVSVMSRLENIILRQVWRKSEPGSQARKGNLLEGKREGDWPLRRSGVLPF